ncbi:MarR family transcriptional regulator [Streptomyces sp. NPDC051776]|uniref:MarR family winged helix-turn-helix transcriptional regulator n=1 Tax=Streptomyces sp. NPDC051776 TaxID=3155414 RepID=UPI0034452FA3
MEPSLRGLEGYLGFWLRRLSDTVAARLEQELAKHGVTVSQWDVLITVHRRDATTAREVAEIMQIDPGAVSRLVDRLVAKGLMARELHPSSRRSLLLTLTEAGQALVPELSATVDRHDRYFFGHLDQEERAWLTDWIVSLLEHSRSMPDDDQ